MDILEDVWSNGNNLNLIKDEWLPSFDESFSFSSIWYESGEELEHQNETLFIKFKFDETFDTGLEMLL